MPCSEKKQGATCYPDVAFNLPRLLEAFWSEAHTSYVQVGPSAKCYDSGDGCDGPELHAASNSFTICFAGPSRSGQRVEQRAQSVVVRAESAERGTAEGGAEVFLTGEDVVQVCELTNTTLPDLVPRAAPRRAAPPRHVTPHAAPTFH